METCEPDLLNQKIIDESIDAIIVINDSSKIVLWNPAAEVMFGFTSDETLNKPIMDLVVPDAYKKTMSRGMKDFFKTGSGPVIGKTVQLEAGRKDGTTFDVELSISTLKMNDRMYVIGICRDITERKLIEKELRDSGEALRDSEERLKIIFDYAPDAYYLSDFQGNFTDGNRAAEQLIGYAKGDLVGKNFLQLNLLPEDQIEKAAHILSANVKGLPTGPDELVLKRKDGTLYIVEIRTYPVKIGGQDIVLGIARDISERKKIGKMLEENLHFVNELLDSIPVPVYYKDPNGVYIGCNKAFIDVLGRTSKEQVVGKTVYDLMSKELSDGYTKMDNELFRNKGMQSYEGKLPYADGVQHDVMFHKATFSDIEGNTTGLIGVILDMAKLKKYECEMREVNESLFERAVQLKDFNKQIEELKIRAEEANRSKSQFLANMSHEIRTPMNGILGFSELLMEEELTEEQREYVKTIHESGKILLALINDILDLSKVESGAVQVSREEFYLYELLNGIVAVTRLKAKEKEVELNLNFAEDTPPKIVSDPDKLRQVLINLISNAVKFTDQGMVNVSVRSDSTGDDEARLTVSVADTGCGIPKDKIDIIFEPFMQADNKTTRKYGGTGLGLSITKKLVETLGGNLEVISEPGKGSIFTVSIPVSIPRTISKGKGSDRKGDNTIVIIEDDPMTMKLYRNLFEKNGFRVVGTALGRQALPLVLEHTPTLVILDIILPDISGWEVLQQLKKDETITDIPVVVISVLSEKEKAISLGAIDYLEKPIAGNALLNKVGVFLKDGKEKGGFRVLIVDDDKPVLDFLSEMLREEGYQTIPFTDPQEAMAYIRGENEIDIIILDVFLRDVTGFDLLKSIKEIMPSRDIPVIFITGKSITDQELTQFKGITHALLDESMLSSQAVLEQIEHMAEGLKPRGVKKPAAGSGTGKQFGKILLAEDNEINQKLIVKILSKEGHEIKVASNGREAVNLLEREPFHVVLMDIQMPVMDGYEALRLIKSDDRWKAVPVIALTAHAMKGEREKCLNAGFDGYIPKPVNREDLIREVASRIRGVDTGAPPPETPAPEEDQDEELAEIYREFDQGLSERYHKMTDAVMGGDYETVYRIGHDLKGSGGAFGREKISLLGGQIEHAAKEKNGPIVEFLLGSLKEEIERIQASGR